MKRKKVSDKNPAIAVAANSLKPQAYYLVVITLWSAYAIATLVAPNTTSGPLRVSTENLFLIRLSIAIPYLLIWLAATYSFIKIRRYSLTIAPSKESTAFKYIAYGILLLLLSLSMTTLVSTTRTALVNHEELRAPLTILTNYLYIFPYLGAFALLFTGAYKLNSYLSLEHFKRYAIYAIPFLLFAYFWLESIFTNQFRVNPPPEAQLATYYLKDSLLVLTFVFPGLIAWSLGFLAALRLKEYHAKVQGSLYRSVLSSLVYGIIGVIIASIFLQALLSLGIQRLVDLGLSRILLLIYLFLLIQGIGFLSISNGAKKLTRIESV